MLRIVDRDIIGGDSRCGDEGVPVSVHEAPRARVGHPTPIRNTPTRNVAQNSVGSAMAESTASAQNTTAR